MNSPPPPESFAPFAVAMAAAGQSELAIAAFSRAFAALEEGADGFIREAQIRPAPPLPELDALSTFHDRGVAALGRACVVKLNGGLGTSMGMTGPKSLLPIKGAETFLDLTAGQIRHLRSQHGVAIPLLLMNSFRTQGPSLAHLARYPDLAIPGLPLDLLQHQVPKILADSRRPATAALTAGMDPALAWCPPGHGDLYVALQTSGVLASLRKAGIRWAFVSNADNLGAALDPAILGWMAAEARPFVMEVCHRTEADKKGGHLAADAATGELLLRERAQCAPEDEAAFQDWQRHRYFNTNNLWVDLDALASATQAAEGVLPLPLIVNRKTLDPTDLSTPTVLQLETAMGAAIASFPGAAAVAVPRARFVPVKTTADLLSVRSDAMVRTEDARVVLDPERRGRPVIVTLDPAHYRIVADLQAHFAAGPPSLVGCERLDVVGDVHFEGGVICRGTVRVEAAAGQVRRVPAGTVLDGG